ncbi:MAG: FlgD immunoglobulin-like domain containing protein [Chromatiales bacterium]
MYRRVFLHALLAICVWISSVSATELNFAPDCSQATAHPDRLWPVNHEFVPIAIEGISDPENGPLTLTTQCIVQDEPLNAAADGNTEIDGAGLDSDRPLVRAERAANRDGRVYHVVFEVSDPVGDRCIGQVAVEVPHSEEKELVVDSGARVPSAAAGRNCDAHRANNPPVIYSAPPADAQVGLRYFYDVEGHDPDRDVLTYRVIDAPPGMSIDPATGILEWVPAPGQDGARTVLVEAEDPEGLIAAQKFEIYVEGAPDELSAQILAYPDSGISPLRVRLSPQVRNNNLVIKNYQWDFDGDGNVDATDTFGAPRTYTYTGNPGDVFTAQLTVNPAGEEPIVSRRSIRIENMPPSGHVTVGVTNGHAPLDVVFSVTATDEQGIRTVSIDFEGDGAYDEVRSPDADGGTWLFAKTYYEEGTWYPQIRIVDSLGAATVIANNAISVDVNHPADPVVTLSASQSIGDVPLLTRLTAAAELFDESDIAQWAWDLDGDGRFEAHGGTRATDTKEAIYSGVDYHFPVVEVTTTTGRTARASMRIETRSAALPAIVIPNDSDTINVDASQQAKIRVSLPYESDLELWVEDAFGKHIETLQASTRKAAGEYEFYWSGTNARGEIVAAGDYYAILAYSKYGMTYLLDLRETTGGKLSYYRRKTSNPRTFDRLESPLKIDFEVDDPAEVTFFWQVSFGQRLMTLMEHERMGRGRYSLYWNGEYPDGQKLPGTVSRLMPGIVRYSLPANVIFVKETPRIESFTLASTIITDPRREPVGIHLDLSKESTVELIVADMEKGIDVAHRLYTRLPPGRQMLSWDGKNNAGQYLAQGDYRIGVRSVDDHGARSLYWYRTQRIDY